MLKSSEQLTNVFSALADPTRRAMIERLAKGPASVSDLARPLNLSLPLAVQHLKQLERSGVVTTRKTGRVRTCQINAKKLAAAETWIEKQRTLWHARFDSMDAFLMQGDKDE